MKKEIEIGKKVQYTITGEFELDENLGLRELIECLDHLTDELRGIASVECTVHVPQMIIKV